MIHHFICQPTEWKHDATPLVFDWDDETGEVTGSSASEVLAAFEAGSIDIHHPIPSSGYRPLTSTKDKTDMAAVIGWRHELPPELAGHYPRLEDDWDGVLYDEAGNVVGHVLF